MLAVLEQLEEADAAFQSIAQRETRAKGTSLLHTKLLAPVLYPGDIYCAGANYTDHIAEMARAQGVKVGPTMKELGELPWHFIKAGRSTVVGPSVAVKLPPWSKNVDWEIELAAVIGKRAKDVPVERALDYVAGYTIGNDLSARDAGWRTKTRREARSQWIGSAISHGGLVPDGSVDHAGFRAARSASSRA